MALIPRLTNWETIEAICHARDANGEPPLYIRRVGWGEPVNRWIFYRGGAWYQWTVVAEVSVISVVEMDEFFKEDFFGEDWTALSVDCLGEVVACDIQSDFLLIGYYALEVDEEFTPDFTSPNSLVCGSACALPEMPFNVADFGNEIPEGNVGDGGGGSGTSGGGTSGGGTSGSGSGSGSSGGAGSRKRRPKPLPRNDLRAVTLAAPVHDIPDCLPRLLVGDVLCALPANPYPYEVISTVVTLKDLITPNAIWFVKVHFKGQIVLNSLMKNGDSLDVTIPDALKDSSLRWGFSHGIHATAWRQGEAAMEDQEKVTMTFPCEADYACPVEYQEDIDVL